MKKVVFTTVISCVLILLLLLCFVKFIVNAPQPTEPSSSVPTQSMGTIPVTAPSESTVPSQNPTEPKPSAPPETKPVESKPNIDSTLPTIPSSPSNDKNELPLWKKQYANYVTVIQTHYTPYDGFALVYIDDDDIPELYMYRDGSAKMLAMRGNNTIGIDLEGAGGGNYHEKSGHFMNVYQDGQHLVMRIYHLTNAFYEVFCGTEDKTTDPPTYYTGDSAEVAVTEQTYKYLVAQYIDTDKVTFLHENALSYDEFMELMKK